ncbi:MAG: hypothetical protein PHU12_01670 [Candidatus Aenigmarchaeota archaeon]|nr:hypothetical protein [Candidatus Aenigmarchaeota archaeon]
MVTEWIVAPRDKPKKYPNSICLGEQWPSNFLSWLKIGYLFERDENGLVYAVTFEEFAKIESDSYLKTLDNNSSYA